MRTRLLILIIFMFLGRSTIAQSNGEWIVRLGATGTGTFDEGIWNFNALSSFSSQKFIFKNAWGMALDLHYRYQQNWATGLHFSHARTGFTLEIDNGGGAVSQIKDPTSFTPLLLEQHYQFRPQKIFRPYLGICGGFLFTRNIELDLPLSPQAISFKFQNPFIYGMVLGADVEIGQKGWLLSTSIRALTFDYTLDPSSVTDEQTLLDQVFWMNYNHIQLGIGKKL